MEDDEQSGILKFIIMFAFVELIVAAAARFLINRLLPYTPDEIRIVIAGVLVLLIAGFLIFARKETGWKRAAMLMVPVLILGVLFFASLFPKERTLYFIVDASDSMTEHREQISRIHLEGLQAPRNLDLGLMVFGGGHSDFTDCEDMVELVEPLPKNESLPQIAQAINSLEAIPFIGPSALQEAVHFSLEHLSNRRGVHQILLLTSGYDERCEDLNRTSVDETASQQGLQYELIVLTVGEIDEEEEATLMEFADSYHHIPTGEDLEDVINDIVQRPPAPYGPYDSSN